MKLAIVAGEASGDLHASEVVQELKGLDPALTTFGIGGDLLEREGMTLLHHAREMGIVGLFNVIRHVGTFRRIFAELVDRIASERPDAVLLIDYPEFNLRVARRCKELGLRVVYYISPQIWAWRQGRVKQIAKTVDRMIVILPFEEELYRKHGVPVTYVGHPLIGELQSVGAGFSPPRVGGLKAAPIGGTLRIALMPGSRKGEVQALLRPMLDAVNILKRERDVDAFIIRAPTIKSEQLRAMTGLPIVEHERAEALAVADIALSSSGTATLEAAVLGTPVVVMYRLSRLNHLLATWLVRLPHFGLINILAGKEVVPELLQHDVNGARIAAEVRRMTEPATYARLREELAAVKTKLGDEGASRRAAEEIMALVRSS